MIRLAAVGFLIGVCVIGCDSMFYFPSRQQFYTPATFRLKYEDVAFSASDGVRLSGWFIPHQSRCHPQPIGTVVHFHGNAENMTSHVSFVAWMPTAGFNLLTFDYRGYGKSAGRVTRAGTVRDGLAAIDYVLARPDVDPQRVFVFGQSLGGAVALVAVAQRPQVRAIVVDSAFHSYRGIAALHLRQRFVPGFVADGLAWLLLSGEHEPLQYLERIPPRPLLVIASMQDSTCPPQLSEALYSAALEPKQIWRVEGAGHTEALMLDMQGFQERVSAWFERAAPPR